MSDLFASMLQGVGGNNPYTQMLYQNNENPLAQAALGLTSASQGLYNPFKSTGSNIATAGLTGLAGALLAGLGARQTRNRNEQLLEKAYELESLEGDTERQALVKSNPRLAPVYAQIRSQEKAAEAARAKAEMEAPKTREVKVGGEVVTQQWDPLTRQFVEVGRAPRKLGGSPLEAAMGLILQNQFGDTPDKFQKDLVKEEGVIEQYNRSRAKVAEAFDSMKDIPSLQTLNPRSGQKTDFEAKKSALMLNLASALPGPENESEYELFRPLIPQEWDTKEQIEKKKAEFLAQMDEKRPSTPTINRFGSTAQPSVEASPVQQAARERAFPKRSDYPAGPEGARQFLEAAQKVQQGQ